MFSTKACGVRGNCSTESSFWNERICEVLMFLLSSMAMPHTWERFPLHRCIVMKIIAEIADHTARVLPSLLVPLESQCVTVNYNTLSKRTFFFG